MGAETYQAGSAPGWNNRPYDGDPTRSDGERATEEIRSIGRLFGELSTDMSTLLRQEVQLAQAETMEKVRVYGQSAGLMGAGGAVAYAGLILVLVALAFLLAQWMEFWLAAGLVGLVAIVIGAVLLLTGRGRMQSVDLTPHKTINTAKELVQEVKETVQ